MNLPSGLIFYMDFKYGSTNDTKRPNGATGASGSLFGNGGTFGKDNLAPSGNKLGSTQEVEGGLYGAGRFGYTVNDKVSSVLTATVTTASWGDVNFDGAYSASAALGELRKVKVGLPSDADFNSIRTFSLTGSLAQLPQFTSIDSVGSASFFVSASVATVVHGAGGYGNPQIAYAIQPTDISRGDFEDRGQDLAIPEIELELKSEPIVAKTRKLKAIWTPELAQDLNAYHSVDAEAELTQMLSEYISLEIDLEILEMLQQNAFTTDYWSARVGYDYNSATGNFAVDSNAAAASAYTKSTWYQTLGIKLQKVSNKIHQLTMRGGANFIVCSPNVATILESMNGFS